MPPTRPMDPTMRDWREALATMRDVFGLHELRPGQEEVIRAVLAGQDTLAIMPTGAGKSLCYQLPGLVRRGTTVVVSPLISLMKDQAGKLEGAGIDATELHSALLKREAELAAEAVATGRAEFVLVTPERLADPGFRDSLAGHTIDLVVVDEAHCISQWGHDFRPAYLAIRDGVELLGRPPLLALTATAPPDVVGDIVRELGMRDARVVNTGIYRPNLHYEVVEADRDEEKDAALLRILREVAGPGIVYTATVRTAERLYATLSATAGREVLRYHGRLATRERKANQDRFMAGGAGVMVATNAFGMGVDKADIRFVVHFELPPSLDAYYQESGRAGRDGNPARCALLFRRVDKRTPLFFMAGRYPTADDLIAVHAALERAGAGNDGEAGGIALRELQAAVPVARNKTRVALNVLKQEGLATESRGARFRIGPRRASPDALARLADAYGARGDADRERLDRMVAYAQSARCRWHLLLEYFEAVPLVETCGTCDNCRVARAEPEPRARVEARARTDLLRGLFVRVPGRGSGRIEEVTDATVVVRWENGDREEVAKEELPPQHAT